MIRRATKSDVQTIVSFNMKLAEETENLELNSKTLEQGIQALLTDPSKGYCFLYEQDGQVVGQLLVTFEWSDWRNQYFWWIQSVYVLKKFRRRGIFQSLYQHVKEIVEEDENVCGIRLYVERENRSAQSTYENLGMEKSHYKLYEWKK